MCVYITILYKDTKFLLGKASAPPFVEVTVTEICETGCTLDVSWSEPVISCGGSVSQYVLTVTPPTSDFQSSGDCVVMDGSSVITTPGTQTQYTFNVNVSQSDIAVRADTCDGSLTGNVSSTNTANITGASINIRLIITHHNSHSCCVRFCH